MQKRILVCFLTGLVMLSSTACSMTLTRKTGKIDSTEIASKDASISEEEMDARQVSSADNTPAVEDTSEDNGYLTVYFSYNDDLVDQYAGMIHSEIGGQIEAITPTEPYTATGDELIALEAKEKNSDARPEFEELEFNPEKYDTIFIGYPIWDEDMPMILYSFFDTYDFAGKKIIPFCVDNGSGMTGTQEKIEALEPNATVISGRASVKSQVAEMAAPSIRAWLRYAVSDDAVPTGDNSDSAESSTESAEAAATE